MKTGNQNNELNECKFKQNTESDYARICYNECIVSNDSANKFLSLQEFLASNYLGRIGNQMKLPGKQMGERNQILAGCFTVFWLKKEPQAM